MSFSELIGKTLKDIQQIDNNELIFKTENEEYRMHHYSYCCERVSIEEIVGNLNDLIGSPIIQAEESSNSEDKPLYEHEDSWTWTFYRIATAKRLVVIRWYGSSNGYYSESVDFELVKK